MIDNVLNSLSIPDNCLVSKKLDKKEFIDNFSLNINDKKILSQSVDRISLEYILNNNTINIATYIDDIKDYSEIAIIKVQISNIDKLKAINSIIQLIPYPLIVFFSYENQLCLSICPKRINKADSNKLVVDEVNFSKWIDLNNLNQIEQSFLNNLNINNHPFTDFLSFYDSILDTLISFNASKYTNSLVFSKNTKEILDEIQILESNIVSLKNKIKKETNFNEKINLNISLKETNDKLIKLQNKLIN